MKQFFHKIMSLVIAFVVLFSTMSFTINMHYCGDTLVETAIFHRVKGCGMDMENASTEGCSITKKNCCNDKQEVVDGQDELQIQLDKISFEQQQFLTSCVNIYMTLFEGSVEIVRFYKTYRPPLVIRQLYKIDETYLI
jgi:hypothetical protein